MARVDYDQMAATYDRGRGLSLAVLEAWRAALAAWLLRASGRPVLDLGAGTGVFAAAIATWFDTSVVAVEPSAAMRRQAQQVRPHPRVAYVGGQAERLPLRDGAAAAPGCRPSSTTSATCPAAPESSAGSFIRGARC